MKLTQLLYLFEKYKTLMTEIRIYNIGRFHSRIEMHTSICRFHKNNTVSQFILTLALFKTEGMFVIQPTKTSNTNMESLLPSVHPIYRRTFLQWYCWPIEISIMCQSKFTTVHQISSYLSYTPNVSRAIYQLH